MYRIENFIFCLHGQIRVGILNVPCPQTTWFNALCMFTN